MSALGRSRSEHLLYLNDILPDLVRRFEALRRIDDNPTWSQAVQLNRRLRDIVKTDLEAIKRHR